MVDGDEMRYELRSHVGMGEDRQRKRTELSYFEVKLRNWIKNDIRIVLRGIISKGLLS